MTDPSTPMLPNDAIGFARETYGSSFADVYDEWYSSIDDLLSLVRFIEAFGAEQKVLELGVGTGRLASNLASNGHRVIGIDTSLDMLERFDRKTESLALAADMIDIPMRSGSYDLVIGATNALFNLDTEGAQARCLAEARRVLRAGGRLVVETAVPGEPDLSLDRLVTTKSISIDQVVLIATIRDNEDQTIVGSHIEISEGGIKLRPWRVRFVKPEQLDQLARVAGFHLGERVADWNRAPFDEHSTRAISVYVAV